MRWWLILTLAGCPTSDPADDDDATAPVEDDDDSGLDDDDATPAPCTTWSAPELLATVDAPWLDEASGLAVSRTQPVLWVIEDSGNLGEVIALGFDGALLARVDVFNHDNRDWEDLALGPCPDGTCLFVGDIGDNARSAPEVALLRFPEPKLDLAAAPETLSASATRLPFRYAEGAQDAEALVIEPDGTPVVLTKTGGGVTQIYRLDALVPDTTVEVGSPVELSTFREGGPVTLGVTGADLTPDGTRLLVREYFDLQVFDVDGTVDTARNGVAVPFEPEPQAEAVAWDGENERYLTISEIAGGSPSIYLVSCVTD